MKTIQAVYEKGIFRPIEKVNLPENSKVEFEPRLLEADSAPADRTEICEVLSERYSSGETDVAERHNEHQP